MIRLPADQVFRAIGQTLTKDVGLKLDGNKISISDSGRTSRTGVWGAQMADLTTEFLEIRGPNPFWLTSAPPTDKKYNVRRAFETGWGGVHWKTIGEEGPLVVNINDPR